MLSIMEEFVSKLGLDWRLFTAQLVNFLLLLFILKITVYKPVLNMLADRSRKIEQGIKDAEASTKRLSEINQLEQSRLAEATAKAEELMRNMEKNAVAKEVALVAKAEAKAADLVRNAEARMLASQKESEALLLGQAKELIRSVVFKIAKKDPEAFDARLVEEAFSELKKK